MRSSHVGGAKSEEAVPASLHAAANQRPATWLGADRVRGGGVENGFSEEQWQAESFRFSSGWHVGLFFRLSTKRVPSFGSVGTLGAIGQGCDFGSTPIAAK